MKIGTAVTSVEHPREIGTIVGRDYSSDWVWVRWAHDQHMALVDPEDLKIIVDVPIDKV